MVVVIKRGDSPEKIKKELDKIYKKQREERKKLFESFVGVITLDEDPVIMQRRWRDEW